MASVTLRSVYKAFGEAVISKDVNLTIEDGEFVVFVGPSGCGKSTLLRMIAGLEDITSGDLLIGEKRMNEVPPSERGIGMVFQSYALYPHLSVADNMSFGLKLAGAKKAEINQRVNQVSEVLQLAHLLDRRPKALSGGRTCSCSTSRCPTSTPRCGCRCASRSPVCTSACSAP
jgi:multiple sugar transport system ATP-binding protein